MDPQLQGELKAQKNMAATSNKRFLGGYVLLVGLPLLGLLAMLRAGKKLNAPISVEGAWEITILKLPCARASRAHESLAVNVSQSGTHLVVSPADDPASTADGAIESMVVAVPALAFRSLEEAAECHAEHPLSLTATVNSARTPSAISGVLSVPGCATCPPLKFTAHRRATPQPAGRR